MGTFVTRAILAVTNRWLVMRFEAPLMAFGGVAIDQVGPTRDFPATSMLTGIIGSALGWNWSDREEHQRMQQRIVFATRMDRQGTRLTDTQNALLSKSDKGWTTHGTPEGRDGDSYNAPHRRFRDYWADSSIRVVLRFDPVDELPMLQTVAEAFEKPARPLFLGRKPCLPALPLLAAQEAERWVTANSAHEALAKLPGNGEKLRAQWPVGQGPETGGSDQFISISDLADLRNWHTGLHAGSRQVVEGWISPAANQ